jgi:hypothetical protein
MAKEQEITYLEQTEGEFKLRGIVKRIDSDHAYKTGTIAKGKSEGKEYRSLKFGIQTSPTNEVPVELFAMETNDVYVWNANKKEGGKRDFSLRNKLKEGETLLGQVVRVGLTLDSEGKFNAHNLAPFDAVEEIFDNLENGDSVTVNGEIEFSSYEKEGGEVVQQTKYIIKNISRTKNPVDFEAEDFVEVNDFSQGIVVIDSDLDKEKKELNLFVRTIGYQNRFADGKLIIDGNTEEGSQLAMAFKKLKFGTFVEVFGKIENKVELKEIPQEEKKIEKSNPFASFEFEKPQSLKGYKGKTYINRLLITGVEVSSFVDKKFTEDDFIVQSLVEDKTKSENNPFTNGDGDIKEDSTDGLWD